MHDYIYQLYLASIASLFEGSYSCFLIIWWIIYIQNLLLVRISKIYKSSDVEFIDRWCT